MPRETVTFHFTNESVALGPSSLTEDSIEINSITLTREWQEVPLAAAVGLREAFNDGRIPNLQMREERGQLLARLENSWFNNWRIYPHQERIIEDGWSRPRGTFQYVLTDESSEQQTWRDRSADQVMADYGWAGRRTTGAAPVGPDWKPTEWEA